MKTALCLSGHLRSFDSVINYFKSTVIDPLNCDIFIHTWDVVGAPTGKNAGDTFHTATNTVDILPTIYKVCKPKNILIESEDTVQQFIKWTNDISIPENERQFIIKHLGYHVSMFYSIYMANKLKSEYEDSHNFIYDLVIRCRADLRFGTTLNESMFSDNNKIYIPKIASYCNEGINDQLAIGSSLNMDKYSDIYHQIVKYYRNHVTTARPEALIKYHLDQCRIPFEKIDIQYDVYRLDGGIFRQYEMHGEMLGVKWK